MEPRLSLITLGVKDLEKSYHFYKNGLGFPTTRKPEEGIIFFKNGGTSLALYPYEALADDVNESFKVARSKFTGITLAYCARSKDEVNQVLEQAARAGAKIEKPAQDVFWGGYSGYFSDPDGYLWEVAYGAFEINPDGSLAIT
ncbi:MAG: VOC family protein [Bdellovibrionaceae bacterium]|nr:VOC family protein [Pseudobdellovibrionaceae bacterium]